MGGWWSTPRPVHFTPAKDGVPIVQEAWWNTGPFWTGAEISSPAGFDPRTVQLVLNSYYIYSIMGTDHVLCEVGTRVICVMYMRDLCTM